ncbi:MAG: hypothetical protein ABWZ76_11930 [Acidimicrobiales bacterium]
MDESSGTEPSEPTPGGSDWERPDEAASPPPTPEDTDRDGLSSDPETGSTKRDPAADESGLPPAGEDPMGGAAPSG